MGTIFGERIGGAGLDDVVFFILKGEEVAGAGGEEVAVAGDGGWTIV